MQKQIKETQIDYSYFTCSLQSSLLPLKKLILPLGVFQVHGPDREDECGTTGAQSRLGDEKRLSST